MIVDGLMLLLMLSYAIVYGVFERWLGESYAGDEYREHAFRFVVTGIVGTPLFAMFGWNIVLAIVPAAIAGVWNSPLVRSLNMRRALHVTSAASHHPGL